MGATYAGEEVTRYFNLTHEWLAQIFMYWIYSVAGFPGLVLARAMLLMVFCALVGLDGLSADRRLLHQPGGRACRRGCGLAFSAEPAVSGDVRVPGGDDGDSGIAPLDVAASSDFPDLGQLPRGILYGLAGAGRLLRRGADPAPAEETRAERAPAMAGSRCLFPGLGSEPQRLPRDPDPVSLYRSSGIQSDNLEWQRPMFWEPGMYSFLLFGTLLVLLLARRRTRPVDWLLYVGFAAISLMAVRNTIFIGLIGPVMMAAYLPKWRARSGRGDAIGGGDSDVWCRARDGERERVRTARRGVATSFRSCRLHPGPPDHGLACSTTTKPAATWCGGCGRCSAISSIRAA